MLYCVSDRTQVDYDAFVKAIQPPDVTDGRTLPQGDERITQRRHSVSSTKSATLTPWTVDAKRNFELRSKYNKGDDLCIGYALRDRVFVCLQSQYKISSQSCLDHTLGAHGKCFCDFSVTVMV